MTEHSHHLADAADAELVRALVAVGRTLAYPDSDLADAVAGRLRADPDRRPERAPGLRWWNTSRTQRGRAGGALRPARAPVRPGRVPVRRGLAAAVLLLGLAAGTAVAAGLGVPGIALRPAVPGAPDPGVRATAVAGDPRFLGRRVSLAEARAQVGFAVVRLDLPGLGAPEVFVADQPPGGRVSLRYPTDGLLLTQFRAELDESFFAKGLAPPLAPEPVIVDGAQGWWVEGRHAFTYLDDDGRAVTDVVPDAAGVLLWSRDGVSYRLESDLPRARAIAVAESAQ